MPFEFGKVFPIWKGKFLEGGFDNRVKFRKNLSHYLRFIENLSLFEDKLNSEYQTLDFNQMNLRLIIL